MTFWFWILTIGRSFSVAQKSLRLLNIFDAWRCGQLYALVRDNWRIVRVHLRLLPLTRHKIVILEQMERARRRFVEEQHAAGIRQVPVFDASLAGKLLAARSDLRKCEAVIQGYSAFLDKVLADCATWDRSGTNLPELEKEFLYWEDQLYAVGGSLSLRDS